MRVLSTESNSYPTFTTAPVNVTDKRPVEKAGKQFDVGLFESHHDRTFDVNVLGTQNIISYAKRIDAMVLLTSSNGVFDGQNAPYKERHKPKPLHVCGRIKYKSEK